MRAYTEMCTVICTYCQTPKTYKTLEGKNNAVEHIHNLCKKLRAKNEPHRRNDLM